MPPGMSGKKPKKHPCTRNLATIRDVMQQKKWPHAKKISHGVPPRHSQLGSSDWRLQAQLAQPYSGNMTDGGVGQVEGNQMASENTPISNFFSSHPNLPTHTGNPAPAPNCPPFPVHGKHSPRSIVSYLSQYGRLRREGAACLQYTIVDHSGPTQMDTSPPAKPPTHLAKKKTGNYVADSPSLYTPPHPVFPNSHRSPRLYTPSHSHHLFSVLQGPRYYHFPPVFFSSTTPKGFKSYRIVHSWVSQIGNRLFNPQNPPFVRIPVTTVSPPFNYPPFPVSPDIALTNVGIC